MIQWIAQGVLGAVARTTLHLTPLWLLLAARWVGEQGAIPVARVIYQKAGLSPSQWPGLLDTVSVYTTTLGPALILISAGVLYRLRVGSIITVQLAAVALGASGVLTVALDALRLWPDVYQSGGTVLFSQAARPGIWTALIASIVAAFVLLALLTASPRKFRLSTDRTKPVRRLESGPWRADWMPIAEAWKQYSAPAGLILGEAYRPDENPKRAGKADLLRWAPTGHLLTCSGSGGGKGISVVVPNALTWAGPLVITDPAGETLEIVRATRKAMGRKLRVLNLDPGTDGMNVLAWIDPQGERFIEDVRTVVEWMSLEQGGEDDKNAAFKAAGKNLITCLILYVLSAKEVPAHARTLATVRRYISRPDLPDFLKMLSGLHELAHGAVADLAGGVLQAAGAKETFSGIAFNAESCTAFLMSPAKERLLSGAVPPAQRFSPTDILDGDTDVFICLPVTSLETEPQVARVILGSLLTAIYNQGHRRHDTLFLLDEMPRLGQMKVLKTARDFGRKFGIVLWAVIQDLGQLEEAWGKEGAKGWLATPVIRQFFGVADDDTAEMISSMCGDFTAHTESVGANVGDSRNPGQVGLGRSAGYSRNEQGQQTRLIAKSEVLTMATDARGIPDEQIILIRGQKPLRCGLAKYFRRSDLAALADQSRFVPGQKVS